MKIKNIPLNILTDVRQHLGADNEDDTRFDNKISRMTPQHLMRQWTGWHLGDESWATEIISAYEHLKEIENEERLIETKL